MYYHELPMPEHPAKRSRPRSITKLYVHKAEWADMQAIRSAHGSNEIIGVEKFPVIDAWVIEVLCDNPSAASALLRAWNTHCESSPHRP
jgi:hypothetical protein